MKRVLLISNKVMHYRISIYNYFFRRFRKEGFEFRVMSDNFHRKNQRPFEFESQELPFNFFVYKTAVEKYNPDAVILFLRMKDLIIWPLIHWLKFRGIPFACWSKGGNWDAKDSRSKYALYNYIHSLTDASIIYAKSCLDYMQPKFHSKTYVANNTLNFEDFPEIADSKEDIKRQFDIPFDKVVLFVGRISAVRGRKRVDHLIDIFNDMDRKDIGLVLVGSGMNESLRESLNPNNILYLGEVHDSGDIAISKLFKMADVFAMPGHVGLAITQAFFWGLPVVTEEDNHPPEIAYLRHGYNGFIVPRNDLSALKEKIVYLLDDDETRAAFSNNARQTALNEASIESMFTGFLNCVRHLIPC